MNQRPPLLPGDPGQGRTAADQTVSLPAFRRPFGGDSSGNEFLQEWEGGKANNLAVGEKVDQKRFNVGQGFRPAEVEENYPDGFAHAP